MNETDQKEKEKESQPKILTLSVSESISSQKNQISPELFKKQSSKKSSVDNDISKNDNDNSCNDNIDITSSVNNDNTNSKSENITNREIDQNDKLISILCKEKKDMEVQLNNLKLENDSEISLLNEKISKIKKTEASLENVIECLEQEIMEKDS